MLRAALLTCTMMLACAAQAAEGDKLFSTCELILAKRLKAPATYRLVDRSPMSVRKATKEEYLGLDSPAGPLDTSDPAVKELYEQMAEMFDYSKMQRAEIVFSYDAENAYGVPVRSTSECSIVFDEGSSADDHSALNARVDRLDEFDWVRYQQQR